MPHIGIQRLDAGDRQHHRPQREERHLLIFHEEVERPFGVQRLQHFRIRNDAACAQHRQHDEPQQHHRSEQLADAAGTVLLNGEQQRQHQNGERHDIGVKRRRGDFQPLDRRHHRDSRGDHHLAIEEAAADQAQYHQHRGSARRGVAPGQRHQRQNTALAGVVRAHHVGEIFEGNDHDQHPENQRQEAENHVRTNIEAVMAGETLSQRIERAGADITVDHADGRQGYRR